MPPQPAKPLSFFQRWRRRLLKTGLVLFVFLVMVEIALRITGHFYQARQLEAMAKRREDPNPPITVITMGESTTGGLWLPFEQSYPKQLEARLREHYGRNDIEVLVPPHSGQNTSQMVHRFDGYLHDFKPALVIFMVGVNNGWSLAESNLGDFLPANRWQTYMFRLRRVTDDIKVVRLLRLATSSAGEARERIQRDMEGAPMMTQWPPKPDRFLRGVGDEPFMKLYRSDVGRMIEMTQAAKVGAIMMTYPNYETPPLAEIEAMATKYSLPLIENHKSFQPYLDENRALEVFFDDIRHPNAAGYAIVVDNIMQLILEKDLLGKALAAKNPPS